MASNAEYNAQNIINQALQKAFTDRYQPKPRTGLLDFVKNKLQESTLLKGNYQFGRKKNITFEHNLADELRNRLVEKLYFNRYEEAKPQVGLGFQFGQDDRWKGKLTGSKGNVGFNLGASF